MSDLRVITVWLEWHWWKFINLDINMKVNKKFRFSPKFFDETETSILFRFFGIFGSKFFSLETLVFPNWKNSNSYEIEFFISFSLVQFGNDKYFLNFIFRMRFVKFVGIGIFVLMEMNFSREIFLPFGHEEFSNKNKIH
jgi:hypothetical protein